MKHHNFRSEIMSYTNLLQNQMMIFQNKQMIDAQTQTNLYLSQTNAHLLEVEKIRKKERQIDIWMEEFKYQGMSPIEAQNQALAEWDLLEIRNSWIDYKNEIQYIIDNALQSVKDEISNRPLRKAILGNWSGKFISISETSDEVIKYQFLAEKNYKDKIIRLNEKLLCTPKSKLADDTDLRTSIADAATNPSGFEVLEEVSELLDSLISQFRVLQESWQVYTDKELDFPNRRKEYPNLLSLYDEIQVRISDLNRDLSEFSINLLLLVRNNKAFEEFEIRFKYPFDKLRHRISDFEISFRNPNCAP